MIEISNTFILVWLVVLAIICIYLLYMSLTRNNEADGLKSTISNLVRQNKKRDELINFLMERVETLTGAVNALVLPPVNTEIPITINQPQESGTVEHVGIQEQPEQSTHTSDITLDDVLNSIPITESNQPDIIPATAAETISSQPVSTTNNAFTAQDFQEELSSSEFSAVIPQTITNNINHIPVQSLNLDDVLNSIPTTFKEDDLISTILGADDSASQHGGEDHSNLPPEKIRLLGMNVKQLKQIAKDMNIKSRGNKTELVDSIWEKMSSTPANNITNDTSNDTSNILPVELNNDLPNDLPFELKDENTNSVINSNLPQLIVEDLPDDI